MIEPFQQQVGPLRGWKSVLDSLGNQVADAVSPLVEDFQVNGHAEFFQIGVDRFGHLDGRASMNAVVRRVDEKHRRRVFVEERTGDSFCSPMPGVDSPTAKSGRLLWRSTGSVDCLSPASKFAARLIARLAPAE